MNADRLREAADRLDNGCGLPDCTYDATADLLRAQAEYHDTGECLCTPSWTDHVTGAIPATTDYPCAAALALADVILGDVNE